jgi:outer membrane protein assembly factor BamB
VFVRGPSNNTFHNHRETCAVFRQNTALFKHRRQSKGREQTVNKKVFFTVLALILVSSLMISVFLGTLRMGQADEQSSDSSGNPNSWPMFHNDLSRTGYSSSTAPMTNQTQWIYATGGEVYSSPAIEGGVVYVGSYDGNLYALNATTGNKIWSYTTSAPVQSSPAVANGTVYVGSSNGYVYAINSLTGILIWKYKTGNAVWSSPAVAGGVVYVGSNDANEYALDAATGAQIWKYTTGIFLNSSAAVANGIVYAGSWDRNVYALSATSGAKIWNYTTGGFIESSPAVANGVVYIGSDDGYVYALNASTGTQIWKYMTGLVEVSPAVANGIVYVGSGNLMYALNANNGSEIWSRSFTSGFIIQSSAAVASGVVYFGSNIGQLYALDASTGTEIWNYTTGAACRSSPAVANGVVYIGSDDDKVYAFGPNPQPSPTPSPTPSSSPIPTPTAMPTPTPSPPTQSLSVTLTPSEGPAGTQVVVQITNYPSTDYTFSVTFGTSNVGTIVTSPEFHAASTIFSVPTVSLGKYVVTVTGSTTGDSGTATFDVTQTSSSTPTPTPSPTPSPTPNPMPLPQPTLTVSCVSSTSYSSFNVEINGKLAFDGTSISGTPIALYYSINQGRSWQDLTLVNTASDGSFLAEWLPSVTGNYLINATFAGNSAYSGVSTIVNLAVVPLQNTQDVFSVASNSTITDLMFNSTSNELTFTASGPSGTTGYVDVYIAKSLIGDISTLQVYLDGNQISYTASSQGSSWLTYFTFGLSTHQVTVYLASKSVSNVSEFSFFTVLAFFSGLLIVTVVFTIRKLKLGKTGLFLSPT